jgi:peptide/nickel transport system ATP-binding protein
MSAKPILDVRDVSVRLGGRKGFLRKTVPPVQAVNKVSLELRSGEILSLVGESGSGKTTLGRSIAGLVSHHGEISWGVEHRRHGRREIPKVQVVFQNADLSLNPRRTVRQVLGRSIELLGGEQTVEQLADSAGIDADLLDKLPAQLSGGQKQRVAIARAFAGQVPLVVCDEPTSALDVSIQARILRLLRDLQERTGVSCLFISHDLAVVRQVSHRIGVLYDGKLVELKRSDEIFEAPEHPYTQQLVQAALSLRQAGARSAA